MNDLKVNIIFVTLLCIILNACSTKKVAKERTSSSSKIEHNIKDGILLERGPKDIELDMRRSKVNLKYKLNKQTLSDTFNRVIDTLLAENKFELEDYNVQVTIQKVEQAHIEFEGKQVLMNFPMDILAEKETFLQKLNATGQLQLQIVTNIDIDKEWNLSTQTELVDYYWREKPKVSMGRLSIPIENIMNLIIDKTKTKVVSEIDEAVKENVGLRDQMLAMKSFLDKSITLDSVSNIHLTVNVDSLSMTPALNTFDWTEGIITLTGNSEISNRRRTKVEPNILPKFSWLEPQYNDDISSLNFNVDLEFQKIETMLNDLYKGKRFSEGDHEIIVRNIELRGLDEKLGVIVDVKGSYDGQIFMTAIPEYNEKEKTFTSSDIELKLLTDNVLHKALGWMLKGRIKKELDKTLQISLLDILNSFQEQIDQQITNINRPNELEIVAKVEDLVIEEFRFSEEKIHAALQVPMYLEVMIFDLVSFDKL